MTQTPADTAADSSRKRWKWFLGLLGLALVVALSLFFRQTAVEWLSEFAARIEAAGVLGMLILVLVGVVWMLLLLPLSVVFLLLGALYGSVTGTALAFLVNVVGGLTAFWLGRTLLRPFLLRWLSDSPRFSAIDRAVEEEGLRASLLLRAGPVPGWMLNYGLGATSVSWQAYLLASVSVLPMTWLITSAGSAMGGIAGIGEGGGGFGGGPLFWSVAIAGAVATLLVLWFVRRRSAELLDRMPESPERAETAT